MVKELSFIHAADIHLGSYIHASCLPTEGYEIFQNATYEAFKNICDAAIRHEVDFLLLSGDLYDQESRSVKASRFFNGQCERLKKKGIAVYIIAGNHDPYREINLLGLPENVFLFDSETVGVREFYNDQGDLLARIMGQSYRGRSESRKMYSGFTPPDNIVWNIGLLHSQLDVQNNNYVPCSVSDLRSKKEIDYWALGHIHQCRIICDERGKNGPVIAYPGIPQGRDFGEVGMGGCLLVELGRKLSGQKMKISFIPTSPIILKQIELKIDENPADEPRNLADLEELILKEAEMLLKEGEMCPDGLSGAGEEDYSSFLKGYIVQWILTGRGEIHQLLMEQEEEVIADLTQTLQRNLRGCSPFIWTDSVVIRTGRPIPDLEILQEKNPFFKELRETSRKVLECEELKAELLRSLGQIWEWQTDHENTNEEKFQLDDRSLQEIVKQAEGLIIEKLLEGRENS